MKIPRRACYHADYLLMDFYKDKLEKDLSISAEIAAKLKRILTTLGDFSAEELGDKINVYGIIGSNTKNLLSNASQLNLMFRITIIAPFGLTSRIEHSEAVEGIFVDFKHFGHKKLPFVVAHIGPIFRNEISPHQGLLRIRELTVTHINHFVNLENKYNQNYSEVVNLEFMMFPREEQMSS
ncbi:hypothetical protein LWI29_030774 [Acer saccharum]|uniref:Aminoacyl-tRNA synthetase class II (G/ P/ S/T) domain-containing protein n=1 Tax=Acer saccharum TaxID=4024 RepID=A0AA39TLB9_ACESA|nr:hypothetical protein LWI29_030774 [Acer saccharum]